jgi:multidrug efflux pump subunit AcrA (membrane-fusion protein)
MNSRNIVWGLAAFILVGAVAVYSYLNFLAPVQPEPTPAQDPQANFDPGVVSAEGRVLPASSLDLGFTQSGRVSEVSVSEGDEVRAGDVLARLDTAYLTARVDEARAAQAAAEANLEAARTQLEQVRQAAQAAGASTRTDPWRTPVPSEMDQPSWYFERDARIRSAQVEVEAAREFLERETQRLQRLLEESGGAELVTIEQRLANAQAAFLVAREVRDLADAGRDSQLQEQARRQYDVARSELEAAATMTCFLATQPRRSSKPGPRWPWLRSATMHGQPQPAYGLAGGSRHAQPAEAGLAQAEAALSVAQQRGRSVLEQVRSSEQRSNPARLWLLDRSCGRSHFLEETTAGGKRRGYAQCGIARGPFIGCLSRGDPLGCSPGDCLPERRCTRLGHLYSYHRF